MSRVRLLQSFFFNIFLLKIDPAQKKKPKVKINTALTKNQKKLTTEVGLNLLKSKK